MAAKRIGSPLSRRTSSSTMGPTGLRSRSSDALLEGLAHDLPRGPAAQKLLAVEALRTRAGGALPLRIAGKLDQIRWRGPSPRRGTRAGRSRPGERRLSSSSGGGAQLSELDPVDAVVTGGVVRLPVIVSRRDRGRRDRENGRDRQYDGRSRESFVRRGGRRVGARGVRGRHFRLGTAGAKGGTRTPTRVTPPDPKSGASTSSATFASRTVRSEQEAAGRSQEAW